MPCEDRDKHGEGLVTTGRNWSEVAVRQGIPRIGSHHQKSSRGKEGFDPESQREHSPAGTLFSDF